MLERGSWKEKYKYEKCKIKLNRIKQTVIPYWFWSRVFYTTKCKANQQSKVNFIEYGCCCFVLFRFSGNWGPLFFRVLGDFPSKQPEGRAWYKAENLLNVPTTKTKNQHDIHITEIDMTCIRNYLENFEPMIWRQKLPISYSIWSICPILLFTIILNCRVFWNFLCIFFIPIYFCSKLSRKHWPYMYTYITKKNM